MTAPRIIELDAGDARAPEPPCPACNGRGYYETGEMQNGIGGWGFVTAVCDDCEAPIELDAGERT